MSEKKEKRCKEIGCRQRMKIEEKGGQKIAVMKAKHHGEIHIVEFTKKELEEVIRQM